MLEPLSSLHVPVFHRSLNVVAEMRVVIESSLRGIITKVRIGFEGFKIRVRVVYEG
jgi:hypothetical protein